jgi:hypothetical protein
VHAENKYSRASVMGSDAFYQGHPAQSAPVKCKINDDDVGLVPVVQPVARENVASLEDRFDAGILQDTPTPLQDDWMIVNDQNACHFL